MVSAVPAIAGAVAVRLPVEDSGERLGGDGGRIVARLQQRRQPLLAHPLELFLRERRPQRDVGHDRQRIGEPRDRHVQPDRRRIERAAGAKIGAEEVDRVGNLQRRPRPGAFLEHRRHQAGDAEPARRILRAAAENHQVDLGDRHFVQFDDPDRQPVGELTLLNRRQLQRRRRTWRRRAAAVGRLRGERRADGEGGNEDRWSRRMFSSLM